MTDKYPSVSGVPESVWPAVAILKNELHYLAKMFIIESNDGITRQHAETLIKVWLSFQHKNGRIKDYVVTCDVFNNKPAVIDKNQLKIDVAAQFPIYDEDNGSIQYTGFVFIPITIGEDSL